MGCFSYCCVGCGFPLLPSDYGNERGRWAWMTQAVAITPRHQVMHGGITHYGKGFDGCDSLEYFEMYHQACWDLSGNPIKFLKCSPHDINQGWVGETLYPQSPPSDLKEMRAYKKRWKAYEQSFYDIEP